MRRKVFILHEIYGVNDFIKDQILESKDEYTEIECISLYPEGKVFSYAQEEEEEEEEEEAYTYFTKEVDFDTPLKQLTLQLKTAIVIYEEVVLIGFSVGATLAWLSSLPLFVSMAHAFVNTLMCILVVQLSYFYLAMKKVSMFMT